MEQTLAYFVTRLREDFAHFCDARLQEMGLTRGLMFFVIYIGNHPDCSPGALSAALRADTGHTTRSVEKLVRSGFLRRVRREEDRRGFALRLTEAGEEAFRGIHALFVRWDREALADLNETQREALTTLLKQVLEIRKEAPSCTKP